MLRKEKVSKEKEKKIKRTKHIRTQNNLIPSRAIQVIKEYGFDYSFKEMAISYVLFMAVGVVIALFYKLQIPYIALVLIGIIIATPQLIVNSFKRKYENRKLDEVSTYIETMLYSFKNNPMVLEALKDTFYIFEEGRMKTAIKQAITYIEDEFSNGDIVEEALDIIEKEFPCTKISQLHKFMETVERLGGDYDRSIDNLLEDKKKWLDRCIGLKNKCEYWRRNIGMAILIACLIGGAPPYLMSNLADITVYTLYQAASVLVIYGCIFVFVKADRKLARDWTDSGYKEDDGAIRRYEKVENYNPKKAKQISLIYACIPFAIIAIALIKTSVLGVVLGTILLVFMLNQHKIDQVLAKEYIKKELEIAFPNWLMEMSLLLQRENVQVAIVKSRENAPKVMQRELDKMFEDLEEDPEGIEPYLNFMKGYGSTEITNAMKMLYSLSKNSVGDSSAQIADLISRTNQLSRVADERKDDKTLAGMRMLFLSPELIVSFKMICDFILYFAAFSTVISQTGGV